MRLKDGFISFVKGIIIGFSVLVRGVSSGAIFFSLNIYNDFVEAISKIFDKCNRKLFLIAIPALLGILAALIGGVHLVEYFVSNYKLQTIFLFIGIMAGGYRLVIKRGELKMNTGNIILFIFSFVVLFFLYLFLADSSLNISNKYVNSIVLGFLGGFTLLIPGISGILDLTIFNNFTLSGFLNYLLFILFIILGIVLFCKIVYKLLKKFKNSISSVVVALLLGSIVIAILQIDKFTINFVNIFTTILTFLWGYIFVKNVEKE